MKGSALEWATAMWERQTAAYSSYDSFIHEMQKVFEFRTLAAESGWNDEALQRSFLYALSSSLKDELAACDEPRSLELIALAIRIDNRLHERRRERSRSGVQLTFADSIHVRHLQSFPDHSERV